ncbi:MULTISPECIES: glycerate kinase [Thalassospira]|uniref:glycerate kinase type-2 family protein n=1 Tax=Thalassospira TaxID=168934 RepID=UPI000A04E6B6|nr:MULTISPECIES: glycerate kinase [Thalassospira]
MGVEKDIRLQDPGRVKQFLTELFRTAVDAADPHLCLQPFIPEPPKGRTVVIGAGKASAKMAQALEQHWQGELSGLVITRYDHAVPTSQIKIVEASHPVPDEVGFNATKRLKACVTGLSKDDLVICLVSGGGSALLVDPVPGLGLAEKQAINQALLKSGASIDEMNCVRRHLSMVKGGKLAALCHPAKVVSLLISDVPNDHFIDIASGPTVGDSTSCDDALQIIEKYAIQVPEDILYLLRAGETETIKPDDPRLTNTESHLIAAPKIALEAAAQKARSAGIEAIIIGDSLEGESSELGRAMAEKARQAATRVNVDKRPCILLSGGETTVTVKGNGRGGRNVEFLLSLAIALDGAHGIHAVAGDTDGIDGIEEIAGAYISPDTLSRAAGNHMDAAAYLANNDGHSFFENLGDSIITGPTLTNVNDFRAILIT